MRTITTAQAINLPELAQLYRETVQTHGPIYYTPRQVEVWAAFAADTPNFRKFILSGTTFLCCDATGILGFSGIRPSGHVLSAYVRHDRVRQGIGTDLLSAVVDYAQAEKMQRLWVEASEFSLKLFQRFGFRLYQIQHLQRQDVVFQRYLLERYLT
ncbi:MAG: GNAT family N-acetyltransferase [Prochlorotrichaceae cyanobacterium]|jgi:putative acetyltransferase